MERLGLVSVLKVERLVSVLEVWENGTSRSRLGLEGSTSRSRLGIESLKKMERLGLVSVLNVDRLRLGLVSVL